MDRRLSVRKSSSSRISKPSSLDKRHSLPSSSSYPSSSSRPPPTVVTAHLTDFRHIVQQLTGTPPTSASPSPVHVSSTPSKPSRLQRFAPPPLRRQQHNQQFFQHHQQTHQAAPYHDVNHQERHYQYMQQDMHNDIPAQPNQAPILPPPVSPHPNPNTSVLSPRFLLSLSPLSSGDNTWVTPLNAMKPTRFVPNSASVLPPPLPPFTNRAEKLERYGESELEMDPWSPSSRLYSHSSASRIAHASSLNSHVSTSYGFSPSTSKQWLPSPTAYGQGLLPNSPHVPISPSNALLRTSYPPYAHPLPPLPSPPVAVAALLCLSPNPSSYSPSTSFPWLPPWPPSPYFSPPPISPGLFPLSPGLRPFAGSPTGFSFQPANDHSGKSP